MGVVMDFEEWMDSGAHYYIAHVEDAKKAWEAAFEEGYKFANKENDEYEKTLTGDSAV